jgi:hypothetical protein
MFVDHRSTVALRVATHLTHPGEIPGSRGLLWGFGTFLSGPTHVPVRFTPSAQALAVASGELDPEKLLVATLERIEERIVSLRAVAATFPRESRAMLARGAAWSVVRRPGDDEGHVQPALVCVAISRPCPLSATSWPAH